MELINKKDFLEKDIKRVKKISEKLGDFKKRIESIDYIHDKPGFFSIMEEFRKYIVEISVENNFEIFYHSKNYKEYKKFFTENHEYYLRSLESIQALSVMTRGIHGDSSIFDLIDKNLLKESFDRKGKELSFVDYSKAKKFVAVGSGPFPETMLYIYENSDLDEILGLDYNHEAIFMAGEMVSGLGLKNINFHQVDARSYDYTDADIVSIPLFVSYKSEILKKIAESGKDSIQIIITIPKGFMNLVYDGVSNIDNRLKIIDRCFIETEFVSQEVIKLEKYDF